MKKPTPPRTTKLIKVELPDQRIVDAEVAYYPRYRSLLRQGACFIELRINGWGLFKGKGLDYFAAFAQLRKALEARAIKPLCWGARTDVWPSGMQRDMGAGLVAYQLLEDGRNNPDEHSIFDYAESTMIGTVEMQQAHAERWFATKRLQPR